MYREIMSGFSEARDRDGVPGEDATELFSRFLDVAYERRHPMDWTLHLDLAAWIGRPDDAETHLWGALGAARRWVRMENGGSSWIAVALPRPSDMLVIGQRSRSTAIGPRVLSARASARPDHAGYLFQTGSRECVPRRHDWRTHKSQLT